MSKIFLIKYLFSKICLPSTFLIFPRIRSSHLLQNAHKVFLLHTSALTIELLYAQPVVLRQLIIETTLHPLVPRVHQRPFDRTVGQTQGVAELVGGHVKEASTCKENFTIIKSSRSPALILWTF